MAAKKRIQVPPLSAADVAGEIQLTPTELLELTRCEHAAQLSQMALKLAQAQSRIVRLEIEQSARAATDMATRCQSEHQAALDAQRAFAQTLSERYHFDWKTHAYDSDTGIIRRVLED